MTAKSQTVAATTRRRPVLVTGFEPFGGLATNPSHQAMQRLDGAAIAGRTVIGRALPVALARIGAAVAALLDETDPAAVVSPRPVAGRGGDPHRAAGRQPRRFRSCRQ